MLISPADHYRSAERFVTSASALRDFIDEVEQVALDTDCEAFWRGQSDHRWALSSSLSRITDAPTAVTDADLNLAEFQLLKEAKTWVQAPPTAPATDLEWLALLQHHSVPTRMLDFTRQALIATFFAVESIDHVEGRLFAVLIPRNDRRLTEDSTISIGDIPSSEVRLWQPRSAISPRLAAQDGVFILGKLPSTKPGRMVWDDELSSYRLMVRSEVVATMSIPLHLVAVETRPRAGSNTTRCFTARIHVDKASIREQLSRRAKRGALRPPIGAKVIDHARCYPDVDGMRRYSRVWKRLEKGIN